MSGLTGALCVGEHELFDSTWMVDHKEAAAMCAVCPAIQACREQVRQILTNTATVAHYGINGTWAGQLHGRVGQRRPTIASTEAACGEPLLAETDEWDNVSGAGSTLTTSPGTSTRANPVRGSASRGL